MVRRARRGFFGGLTAFPGGGVEPEDHSSLAGEVVVAGGDDRVYRVAALRELAEEVGLAVTRRGVVSAPEGQGSMLLSRLASTGTILDGDSLAFVSRWVTPEQAPKRYDTRFYLLPVSDVPEVRLARDEVVDHLWTRPGAALEDVAAGRRRMVAPTVAHLHWLAGMAGAAEAHRVAAGSDRASLPRPVGMGDGSPAPAPRPRPWP